MTPEPRRPAMLRLLAYTALLYGSFAHNLFCVPESVESCAGEFRTGYLGYDSALVMNRLAHDPGGPSGLTQWDWRAGRELPYRSQYGLQGEVLAAVPGAAGGPAFARVAAGVFAGLTALSLAAFLASAGRRLGPLAGDVAAALTACVPILLPFAPSLYWVPFLLLGPFLAAWFLYPWACRSRGRFVALLGAIAGLVCVKCLCGYEYVTTVILAPVAALGYHATAAGERVRAWAVKSLAVWAVGTVGFAAALGFHARQISAATGEDGLAVIRERAAQRTGAHDERGEVAHFLLAPDPTFLPPRVRPWARCLANYFWLPAVASPQTWGAGRFVLSLGAVVLAAVALAAAALVARPRVPREVVALVPAGAIGFVGAMSWQVLAVNHMAVHAHLNLIVFCIPFLLFVFAGVGSAVQAGAARLGIGSGAPIAVLLAVALVVGGNTLILERRAAAAAAEDRWAAERVAAVLRGEQPAGPPTPWLLGCSLRMTAAPTGALTGAESDPRLTPAARGPGRPCWFLSAVAQGKPRPGAEPVVRLVAVRDGRVIPIATAYRRLTTVERGVGGNATWTGVWAVADAGDGEPPPRLFLVTGPVGESVTEVTLPPLPG
ncbi:MAG: hypothetical protein JWO38_185 [Gemmataceae bacterium]|nr:hypothetical protein [Gemmataceae bacterium]